MLKPYDLLEGVLNKIENGLKKNINENVLADDFSLSSVHLRRLFRFAFRQPIGTYIRSRKLAASVEDLLKTNMGVVDIALEYGLEYEQSYIRAFKREFGITPGNLRKSGQVLKITPPLQLFDSNKLADGLIFGPDIVMVPQFHVMGKRYKSSFRDALVFDPRMAKQFYHHERPKIPNKVNPDAHINFGIEAEPDADYCYFFPAVQVKTLDTIPEGFDGFTFPTSLCANFRFIGPDNVDLNMSVADGMFKAIDDFMDDERQRYFLERKRINFEKITASTPDGFFSRWEWFAPVIGKTKLNTVKTPDGIIKTYQQTIPALRFIGKKHTEKFDNSIFDNILNNLDNWRLNYIFEPVEKQLNKDQKAIYEGGDAYISLIKKKDDLSFEYWLGMFMPPGTEVPHGYEAIDFPKSTWGVCRVYGKRNTIIHYDADCRKILAQNGWRQEDETSAKWFFMRFNWRGFFEDDKFGKRILEYGYYS